MPYYIISELDYSSNSVPIENFIVIRHLCRTERQP